MIDIRLPDGRIKRFATKDPKEAAAAARRYLASPQGRADADATKRSSNTPGWLRAITQGSAAAFSDEIDAVGAGLETRVNNLGRRVRGRPIPYTARQAEQAVRRSEQAAQDKFAEDRPMLNVGLQLGGGLLTGGVGAARTVAGTTARVAARRGATVGAAQGAAYGAGTGQGGLLQRAPGAAVGAAYGAAGGGLLAGAGQAISTRAGAARVRRGVDPEADAVARTIVARVGRQSADPRAMAGRVQGLLSAGVERPTLVDAVDESGRGLLRAAASRMTPAREAAQEFAETRAVSLPDRMGRQARRTISDDPRTPDQIRTETSAQRKATGDKLFGAVRNERVTIDPDTVQAFRTEEGRKAIKAAASRMLRSTDGDERNLGAELNRLADSAMDAPGETEITVGMAQSISESLYDAAKAAQRQGYDFDATSFGRLAEAVRGNARRQVPGYDEALTAYASDSRLVGAAEVGEQFLSRNTDEFVAAVGEMTPEEQALARAAARRAIERKAGESVSAAPGVARAVATAPEQQARSAGLLGADDAANLQQGMAAEARLVRNANDIAPRTGSQTQNKQQDAVSVGGTMLDLATNGTSPVGLARMALNRLKTLGMSDKQAERLVTNSLDPVKLPAILKALDARVGRPAAVQVISDMADRAARFLTPGSAKARGYVSRLGRLAAANPELQPVLSRVEPLLIGASADSSGGTPAR